MQLNLFQVEYQEFHVTNDSIYTLAINQNLQLLAFGGKTEQISILDLTNESIYQILEKTHKLPVLCLIFSKNNQLFQFGFDDYFVIYNYKNKQFVEPEIIQTPNIIHRFAILTNNDESIISIGDTNMINIYKISTRQLQSIILPTYNKLTCITTNFQQKIAIVSGMGSLFFLNINKQKIIFKDQKCSSFYVKMSNNNYLFAEGHRNNINIKSSINKKLIRKQPGNHNFCVLIMRFTKDDKFLISGSMDFSITIFNVIQGGFDTYDNHESYIFSLEFQDQEEKVFYTGSKDFRIGKWVRMNY
ncbi:unnamed protein product [Paramecium pentaurelia]|uniref:WD40-repeat-containing domain n=1 Tax=Paramecium pentaurelia TaxID=43138 RepID=A0A8S1XES8_9CILI|nr:unnamed protein product [Paramecium pentaurelia]